MVEEQFGDLYFDDFQKLRVLEPDVVQQSTELNEESKEFIEKTAEFRQLARDMIRLAKQLSAEVEQEKMKAIACRNMLQTLNDNREAKRQQIQVLLVEKQSHLERLQIQLTSLRKMEAEQKDLMEQLQNQH